MTEAQPSMDIGGMHAATAQRDAPDQSPPIDPRGMAPGVPMAYSGPGLQVPAGPPSMHSAPSLAVPSAMAAGIAAWQNNKKVEALWTSNEDGNSWMGITGIGWKKFAHPSETVIVAMTMLAAHARCTNANINYREEGDNMVHEMYVW